LGFGQCQRVADKYLITLLGVPGDMVLSILIDWRDKSDVTILMAVKANKTAAIHTASKRDESL
jgi:hypothetical protein